MQKRSLLFSPVQKRSGFTLLELLIVLAIILVIAGMVVPNLIGSQKTANERIAFTLVKEMEKAAGNYATDHDGEYFKGNGTEAWQAMINPPAYKGRKLRPYLEEVPIDPW